MVVDNAPCHTNLESVLVDELQHCKILRLSPYSPQLNPIESIWSVLKSKVKNDLDAKMPTVLGSQLFGMSIKEHRLRCLENIIREHLPSVTPTICTNVIASIQARVTPALNMDDLVW